MRRWLYNVLLALDQLGSALTGGSADETISSRLGKWKLARLKRGAWPPSDWNPLYWLERFLDLIDPDHVLESIEHDEGEPAVVWKMNAPRRMIG